MIQSIHFCLTGLIVTCFAFSQDGGGPSAAPFDDASFATWRDRIRTGDAELAWERLPWQVTYHDGLQQAGAEGKPLLLWVMNGHPLGCT